MKLQMESLFMLLLSHCGAHYSAANTPNETPIRVPIFSSQYLIVQDHFSTPNSPLDIQLEKYVLIRRCTYFYNVLEYSSNICYHIITTIVNNNTLEYYFERNIKDRVSQLRSQ